jgi:CheY-like chemotaxis protein
MDPRTLERIFEPFFTTKEVGKGTGLGLATVYGIIKQHQGWIEVASQVGQGTTFKVYFPAVAGPVSVNPSSTPDTETVSGGEETILLVEDEPALRALAREVLETYHYRIIEAGSGVEALRVWDQEDGRIDLLLTDMVMPEGMTGRDLANQLKKRKPELKVIFTSGYSAEAIGGSQFQGETAFLSKPYLPSQLAQFVRKRLDTIAKRQPEPALNH